MYFTAVSRAHLRYSLVCQISGLTGKNRYGTSFSYCVQAAPYFLRHRSMSLIARWTIMIMKKTK